MKARELHVGAVFSIAITGQVLEVAPLVDGRQVRIRLQLRSQAATGLTFSDRAVVEFTCRAQSRILPPKRNRDEED